MDDEDRLRADCVNIRISNAERIPAIMANDFENITLKADEDSPNSSVPSVLPRSPESSDMIEYDLCNISFREVVLHLMSLSVGLVTLSIPFYMKTVFGSDVGFVITLTSLFLYLYSLNTLLWSKYKVYDSKGLPGVSYSSFMNFALRDGPHNLRSFTALGACTTVSVFVLFLICGCCYNVLRAAENIQIVYNSWAADSVNLNLVMIWLIVPLLLLCWLVRYEHLALISIVAHVLCMLCIAAVLYDDMYNNTPVGSLAPLTQMPFYLFGLFFMLHALGSSTCKVPGFGTFISVIDDDEKEERLKFNRLFAGIPVLLVYAVFGFRCSLRYGTRVEDTWPYVEPVQVAHQCASMANAFALLFQYPLLIHLMFDLMENRSGKECEQSESSSFVRDELPRMMVTIIVFISIYNLPVVDVFLILGNAFGSIIDNLLFPAFIITLIMWRIGGMEELERGHIVRNMIIGFLALMLIVLGTISCALDVLQYCKYDLNMKFSE